MGRSRTRRDAHPFVSGKRLLSFSMRNTSCSTSGMRTSNGASVLFFGFHSILAIFEPSGNSLPLSGTPSRYRLDHHGVRDHDFQQILGLADRNDLPILVALEVRERQTVRHPELVLVVGRQVPRRSAAAGRVESDRPFDDLRAHDVLLWMVESSQQPRSRLRHRTKVSATPWCQFIPW